MRGLTRTVLSRYVSSNKYALTEERVVK
jgi:hypothetical protein